MLQGYYLHVLSWSSLTLMFAGLLQKDLFKGGWSLAKSFFKQNYCHTCHTGFAMFFLLALCISSLLLDNTWNVTHNEQRVAWMVGGAKNKKLLPRVVILLPRHPASLAHKNPQRQKIICDMCHVGHKDQIIDLKMSGLTLTICNKITARAKYNHDNRPLSGIHPEALSHFWPASAT